MLINSDSKMFQDSWKSQGSADSPLNSCENEDFQN